MSDQFNEQISEFIDDEMSTEESEFFVRRLQRDAEARRQYLRYQMIGAAMRGERFYRDASELGLRLGEAIDRDESMARSRSVARYAAGAGIVASVALIAIFGTRFAGLNAESSDSFSQTAGLLDVPDAVVVTSDAETQPLVRIEGDVTGIQYLIHHARFTSGVSRTIMQSSVIADQVADPTEDSRGSPFE